jgi:type VI secretion system protein ImpA
MPLRADLLTPIPGDNPSGANLRYDPVIDKIKEARREDVDAPQGAWKTALKTADYGLVIKLGGEVVAKRSKDLQIAVWLVEAHIRREGLPVVGAAFKFIHELLEQFWDTLYPEIEDGDVELRAGPLDWLGSKLDTAIRQAPITSNGLSYFSHKESRLVGFEADAADSMDKLEARNARINEGKLTGEQFDEAVDATPMGFYGTTLSAVNDALAETQSLLEFCDQRFGDEAPGFSNTRKGLEDVAQLLELFLRKKGGAVELPTQPEDDADSQNPDGVDDFAFSFAAPAPVDDSFSFDAVTDAPDSSVAIATGAAFGAPQSESDVVQQLLAIARFLRSADAQDVSSYLIVRAYQWGKLRNGTPPLRHETLEPPPTELRVKLKKLFVSSDWAALLAEVEDALGLPSAGPWLDLHRYAVLSLEQQGMTAAATAVRSGIRGLLQDLPELQSATLLDDTAAASADTRAWLDGEVLVGTTPLTAANAAADPFDFSSPPDAPADTSFDFSAPAEPAAPAEPVPDAAPALDFEFPSLDDSPPIVAEFEPDLTPDNRDVFEVALGTLKSGDAAGGLKLLTERLANERSNRGRFRRRTQIAHLLLDGGHANVAAPLLDQLASEIDERKLDEWEESAIVAYPLELLLRCVAPDPAQQERKTRLYARVCKLDPVRAMSISI